MDQTNLCYFWNWLLKTEDFSDYYWQVSKFVKLTIFTIPNYYNYHNELPVLVCECKKLGHYNDIIMGTISSLITSLTILYSTVYSDTDQRKHQSSASLAFVWGIHRSPVNSPHKWPVTQKMSPFDDVIMGKWLFSGLVLAYKGEH